MAYEVLARKYRPQQFDDVVGQEHVTRTLCNAIRGGRIAHAYLFVGPRGIGKTSISRIFAKALNCREGGPTPTPCDRCDSCREIAGGTSLDVLEIDGASNNGVEQVRDLRDNVRYTPARGPYKIYIIDEVHMLSIGAFNALLKTLEEPPPHAKFIFATTEPQKVPSTIASRCQRFDLRRISTAAIVGHLRKIAELEKVDITPDALLAIARGAEGGLRDAESALDQLISFRGKRIEEEDVLSVFGLVSRTALERIANAVMTGDLGGLIGQLEELDRNGKDMNRLLVELLVHFRNLLVVLNAGPDALKAELGEEQAAGLATQASTIAAGRLLRVVEILIETEKNLRHSLSPRILLEAALIRCARASTAVTLDEVLDRLTRLRDQLGPADDAAAPSARPAPAAPQTTAPAPRQPVEAPAPPAAPASSTRPTAPSASGELEALAAEWPRMTERVGRAAPRIRGLLTFTKPVAVAADSVSIAYDAERASDWPAQSNGSPLAALARAASQFLGRDVRIESRPGGGIRQDNASPSRARPDDPPSANRLDETRKQLIENPHVENVLKIFGGSIREIRQTGTPSEETNA